MSHYSTKPDDTAEQAAELDCAYSTRCVTIVSGRPAGKGWWDAPFRKRAVPSKWSPAGLIKSIETAHIPALSGEVVPYSVGESGKCYSFVAVTARLVDASGQRTDLPAAVLEEIRSLGAEHQLPGSMLTLCRGRCVVVFLLERPITRREQPESDTAARGLFHRAAMGAEWLVRKSLSDISVALARPGVVEGKTPNGLPLQDGRYCPGGVKGHVRLVDGLAVQAVRLNDAGVPVDGGLLPSTTPSPLDHLRLADKLWQPEELAAYAPATPTDPHDRLWEFVQSLRDPARREGVKQRLQRACEELVTSCNGLTTSNWSTAIEVSIDDLARFATAWSVANDQLVAAGLAPLGAKVDAHSAGVHSTESIWDPASIFVHVLRQRLTDGDWHIALRDGGVPHGVGVSPTVLGWKRGGALGRPGGSNLVSSGLCIGWVDHKTRELLIDLDAATRDFATRGPRRCALLCLRPKELARHLVSAGLLGGEGGVSRRVLGSTRRVYCVPLCNTQRLFAYSNSRNKIKE